MDLYYDEIKKFFMSEIKVPDSVNSMLSVDARKDLQSKFTQSIVNKIDNANVIVVEPELYYGVKLDNLRLNEFKTINPPFDNMFIELCDDNKKLGIHVVKTGNEIEVLSFITHDNTILPYMFIMLLDKLPRFYVGCPKPCSNKISTNSFKYLNDHMCMRTPRTSDICTYGKLGMTILNMIYFVISKFNEEPINVGANVPVKQHSSKLSSYVFPVNKDARKFIYLKDKVKSNYSKVSTKGSPKSPHSRRGHYRHYKNGKVVWIKPTKIKGGKTSQKFYKI